MIAQKNISLLLTIIALVPTFIAAFPNPASAQNIPTPTITKNITINYTASDLTNFSPATLDNTPCLISPPIVSPPGSEINFHRISANFTGAPNIKIAIGYSSTLDSQHMLKTKHYHSPLTKLYPNKEATFTSREMGQRYAWLILQPTPNAQLKSITYTYFRAQNTLYGHAPATFNFANAPLPYRLMFPKNYDPKKSYPLVVSVPGSGAIGTDNRKSLEKVTAAHYLFTDYYHDPQLQCFSLVTQIPPLDKVPAPYHPKGPRGAPTIYHPDWPAVNAQGWYTQATLALIKNLIADSNTSIDPTRIYFTGFSYGGKACFEFLKAQPDLFAAAIAIGGWPIGKAYSNPSISQLPQLKRIAAKFKHVPLKIFAGSNDPMHFGSSAIYIELKAQNANVTYTQYPGTSHMASATKTWANKNNLQWLFANSLPHPLP